MSKAIDGNWKDIGTAPRGQWVLVCAPGWMVVCACWVSIPSTRYMPARRGWITDTARGVVDIEPTHWQELPEGVNYEQGD